MCNYYHLYYPCFSLTGDAECLSLNTPMYLHFYKKVYPSTTQPICDDAPITFYKLLNTIPSEYIITQKNIIQHAPGEPDVSTIQLYSNIGKHKLIIFDFTIQKSDININNLCNLRTFMKHDEDHKQNYTITRQI